MTPRAPLMALFLLASGAAAFAVETQIQGGRVELLNKGEEILFEGGVRLNRGNDELKARRMRTTGARDRVEAQGDVSLFRRVSATETWKGFGDSGFYETKTGGGFLMGNKKPARLVQTTLVPPRFEETPAPRGGLFERKVDITAQRFDIANEGGSAIATGAVYGKTVDPETREIYEFWSERANYDEEGKTLTLSGGVQPILRQITGEDFRVVKGDVIVYHLDTRRMISTGNASAVFTDLAGRSAK